jgi:adenylate cyclase
MEDRRPRLLVVDDERDMLDFVERTFRRDYRVLRAGSVDEALLHLEGREPGGGTPIDVIISDGRMPGRGGAELFARAIELVPRAARILLTGYAGDEGGGLVDAVVLKPVDADTLREAVAGVLSARKR